MRIDEKLNIVVPVRREDGEPGAYVYHAPISREVFEAHFRALSLMHSEIVGRDPSYMGSGIHCASLIFRDVAAAEAAKRGPQGVDRSQSLFGEIKRLTTVLAPSAAGWELLPVDAAIAAGHLTADEWSEVESALVFFTGAYWMASSNRRREVMMTVASILGSSTTSSLPSEFAAGLPRSTPEIPSIAGASSVPS